MPTRLYFKIHRILRRNADVAYFNFLDQDSLLDELPSALKSEVLSITHKRILDSFNIFKGKPPQFILDILPEFKHISLSKDEVIYRKGGWVEDGRLYLFLFLVYFLLKGRVGFVTENGFLFRNYANGSYFGEVEYFRGSVNIYIYIYIYRIFDLIQLSLWRKQKFSLLKE